MTGSLRVFDGSFGRLRLVEAAADVPLEAGTAPRILILLAGAEVDVLIGDTAHRLSHDNLLFLNPGAPARMRLAPGWHARLFVFEASGEWLRRTFPAVFETCGDLFGSGSEAITPRIRQLANTLAIEVLNDQFLSHERLEFMLQELGMSIVEACVAKQHTGGRTWRGSPLADNRIRKALALLRAHPNKEVNMDALASRVGLSRSRFYDLFQLSTGRSPRAYLDQLCIASAISKLCSGSGRIADVSAELGFSAQSNFTRFFQQQVGIPPSKYRRAAAPVLNAKSDPGD